jgi:hypothetical protein
MSLARCPGPWSRWSRGEDCGPLIGRWMPGSVLAIRTHQLLGDCRPFAERECHLHNRVNPQRGKAVREHQPPSPGGIRRSDRTTRHDTTRHDTTPRHKTHLVRGVLPLHQLAKQHLRVRPRNLQFAGGEQPALLRNTNHAESVIGHEAWREAPCGRNGLISLQPLFLGDELPSGNGEGCRCGYGEGCRYGHGRGCRCRWCRRCRRTGVEVRRGTIDVEYGLEGKSGGGGFGRGHGDSDGHG